MKIRYIINRYEITNWFIITQLTQPFREVCRFPESSHMFMSVTNSYCWLQTWCSSNVLLAKFLKKRKGNWSITKPKLQLALENMDLNTTQRKILHAGNLSLTVVCWNHWNLMLSEGKPSAEEHNMTVSRKCMYNLSTYPLMAIRAHNPNEHVTSIFHFYTLQNSWVTHIMSYVKIWVCIFIPKN